MNKPQHGGQRCMGARKVTWGEGLPLQIDGALMGGIDIGGAPGGHLDEACARAGLDLIEAG
ncbi:hypothetical protein [Ruegeria sp. HKCCD8929]|uniref:hypothetical protein n=1 Tax=Ruegeria sp. HKCCD8929 TaxID=2683006 RepID=UPI0015816262|nr:hypothetical protein [Ruegeria sp. HKCCD8929]